MDDSHLLHAYARDRDQTAFAALVRRHTDLVYSAALRRMNGDSHSAQEVTQRVFIALARKAPALITHPALPAWLHRSTRNAAIDLHRELTRRRARETVAATDTALLRDNPAFPEPAADWTQLAPVLDDALDTLGETDRQTVVLRYFTGASFAEIGATLGLSEAAAQMRAARALEKLRRALSKHGVTSTASALGLALGANAVTAAPASVATATLAALGTAGVATTATGAGIFTLMTTSTKLSLAASAALLAGTVTGWYAHGSWQTQPAPNGPGFASASAGASAAPSAGSRASAIPDAAALHALNEQLTNRLAERDAEIKRLGNEARVMRGMLDASFSEAMQRTGEAGKEGRSVFKNLQEAGTFAAYINQRCLILDRDYPSPPSPGEAGYDDYQSRMQAILRDAATLTQDPLLLSEIFSGDAQRISAAQTSYVAPSLGLNEAQAEQLRATLNEAYREGLSQNLGEEHKPKGDASAWEAARARLNARTAATINSTLTPEQRTLFTEYGYDQLVFTLKIGK